jgi:hypothetical protein
MMGFTGGAHQGVPQPTEFGAESGPGVNLEGGVEVGEDLLFAAVLEQPNVALNSLVTVQEVEPPRIPLASRPPTGAKQSGGSTRQS